MRKIMTGMKLLLCADFSDGTYLQDLRLWCRIARLRCLCLKIRQSSKQCYNRNLNTCYVHCNLPSIQFCCELQVVRIAIKTQGSLDCWVGGTILHIEPPVALTVRYWYCILDEAAPPPPPPSGTILRTGHLSVVLPVRHCRLDNTALSCYRYGTADWTTLHCRASGTALQIGQHCAVVLAVRQCRLDNTAMSC
jgi:hypothetical protein